MTPVNDVPTFTKGRGTRRCSKTPARRRWPAGRRRISPGPPNESGQTRDFLVTNNNNALFSVQPTISSDRHADLHARAPNANGIATVTVQIHDNGGTANGGVDTSRQTFTITVTRSTTSPSFAKGADQTVLEDAGAQSVTGWATAISAGPPDESGQTVNFLVTNNNNALFRVQPTISPNGTLTYTPRPNANGRATVTREDPRRRRHGQRRCRYLGGADLHDQRHGGQRRAEFRQGGGPDPSWKTLVRGPRPRLGDGHLSGARQRADQTLDFL